MGNTHISVLLAEAVAALQVKENMWYIDATFGRGGHTREILVQGGKVIAFDVDQDAITYGKEMFAQEIENKTLILIRSNFEKIKSEVENIEIHGVLFDFGVSSPQLESHKRGFSFQFDADLDMRMDDRLGVKAKDLLVVLSEKQLAEIFFRYGGEENSRKIAKAIVLARQNKKIDTVSDLVEIIERNKGGRRGHLHPATKIFQALRIAVNGELESIEKAIPDAEQMIVSGGRIVTISFHEGEDRIIKQVFKDWEHAGKGQMITKDVIKPSLEEELKNPRARSAKMRIYEKK